MLAGHLLLIALVACESGAPSGVHGPWTAERATLGDTQVVCTLSGSVWGDTMVLVPELAIGELEGEEPYLFGSIAGLEVDDQSRLFVVDRQAQDVRVFSKEGEHLFTMGGPGEGPGEFRQPDHIRVLADGRILVRDGRWRFSMFTPEGVFLETWPILTGYGSNTPFYLLPDGQVLNPSRPGKLVRYGPDGPAADTIPFPSRGFDPNYLEVQNEHTHAYYPRPFSPSEQWTMTRDGQFLFGITDTYQIDRWGAEGEVLRIERVTSSALVDPEEGARARESITESMHLTNPSWNWYGPGVPSHKPPWWGLLAGIDGSIWVLRHTESTEVENPNWDPQDPDNGPRTVWQSPMIADVFDTDGRYLGPVRMPEGTLLMYPPLLSSDRVWLQTFHEMGYPQVVRYRVAPQR